MNPLAPGLIFAFAAVAVLLVLGVVSSVRYSNMLKRTSHVQDEGMDLTKRSRELVERSVQLQEEANNLLREIFRKMR